MDVRMSYLSVLFFLSGASGLIYQIVWVRELGNVFAVGAWCPRCFAGGEPVPEVGNLPAHLELLGRVYADPAFREYFSPYRPPGKPESVRPPVTPAATRALAASAYLQVVFAPPQ